MVVFSLLFHTIRRQPRQQAGDFVMALMDELATFSKRWTVVRDENSTRQLPEGREVFHESKVMLPHGKTLLPSWQRTLPSYASEAKAFSEPCASFPLLLRVLGHPIGERLFAQSS